MTGRALARLLAAWLAVTALACAVVHHLFSLDGDATGTHPVAVLASVWSEGELVARSRVAGIGDRDPTVQAALGAHPGASLVYDRIIADGPVVTRPEALFALSFVPGRDGLSASLDGRTAYATPDDLVARQAYDKGVELPGLQVTVGLDTAVALALVSERLGVTARDVLDRAALRRFRLARATPNGDAPPVTEDTLTDADVRAATIAAGGYLARGVDGEGRFRYLVDAATNRTLSGYDWPRHAGATYFLAQSAELSGDTVQAQAALRAAAFLRDRSTGPCGNHRCVGDGSLVDVGSTALAVLADVEVARAKLDPSYANVIPELTAFLRAQQRPDGEFMHVYDRAAGHPVDVQYIYYSGEAALALSRAHTLLGDPRDLDAATRAVARLVGPAWSFFGSRYYWGEEHWTCQATGDLWARAPNRAALDFCLGWQDYTRSLQYGPGDTLFDADGAFGLGPVVTPRLTPAGSRTEAAIAVLEVARIAGVPPVELGALDRQIRKSLALLIRHQFRPGPTHLLANPAAVYGALPGSEVDWQLRIDYAQHAGSAMVRWLARAHDAACCTSKGP